MTTGAPTRLLVTRLLALPTAARWLFLGTFINRFGAFVLVFLVVWMRDLGFSESQAGLAVGAYGAGAVVTNLWAGLIADRLGRRRAIALSMFTGAAAMLALGQARTVGAVIPLAVITGATAELYRPASNALLSDLVDEQERVVAFTGYRFAINLGFALGPAAAGLLARRSMWSLFVVDAVTMAIFGVIALVALPHGVRTARATERRGEGTRTVLADRRLLLLLVALLLSGMVFQQAFSTFALHVEHVGLAPSHYGLLVSLNGLLIVLLEIPLVAMNQHRPAPLLMAVGSVLTGLGFTLTAGATSMLPLAITVGVWTMGEIVGAPFASAHLQNIAPVAMRGRYAAAVGMAFGAAGILGPVLGGLAFERIGAGFWPITGVAGVAAAGLILASERFRTPRVQPSG